MSITYYYAPMSTAVRTTWAIEELGVPCERVKLDISKKQTKAAAFLKLNPNGLVPLLVVDGTPIFESTAILIYLGETYGVDKGLYPPPGLERAETLKWLVWANVGLYEPLSRWARNTASWVPAEQHNAKAAEAGKSDLGAALKSSTTRSRERHASWTTGSRSPIWPRAATSVGPSTWGTTSRRSRT